MERFATMQIRDGMVSYDFLALRGRASCFLLCWGLLFSAWTTYAQMTATNQIPLTLGWKMADPQPESFFVKGYRLTRFIAGASEQIQTFVPDHSPDPDYTFTYSDLDPGTTYTFRCETVCGLTTNSDVETNSEFISMTFSTGAIVPGDDRSPVISANYANEVIPATPPNPGFHAIYSWSSDATVSGTAIDESHLMLQISGDATVRSLEFQGTGGVWTAQLTLKNIGTNLIAVQATDFFTNTTITNIIIVNLARTNTASLSPNTVTEDHDGWLSFQVLGVPASKPVLLEKFLDANRNGGIDSGDLLCQSITITDGSAFTVGGIPFPAIPGDEDGLTNGRIYGTVDFRAQSELNRMAASYIVRITDSLGQFKSIALPMRVLPRESTQKIVGQVTAGGLPVAHALVFYSSPPDTNWMGGVVTDNAGHYEIACQPGLYAISAFKGGYVCNLNAPPQTRVNPGIDAVVNPALLAADRVIQGAIYDSNSGLGGQQLIARSAEGWAALTTTDNHGNFRLFVVAASYALALSPKSVGMAGCLGLKSNPVVNTLTGDVSGLVITLATPDAVVFGAIKDSHSRPVSGIAINARATSLPWSSTSVRSDFDGFYAIGITAGDWAAGPSPTDLVRHGYVATDWPVLSPTNGQAIYYQYTTIQATAYLSGLVVDDTGTPLEGLSIEAVDFANNTIPTTTDATGAFRIGVSSGLWTLRMSAADSQAAHYVGPLTPVEVLDGENQSQLKLVLLRITGQISGTAVNALNQPISGSHVLATLNKSDTNASYYAFGITDAGGHYSFNLSTGLWLVNLPDLDPTIYITPGPREILMDNGSIIENISVALNAPLSIATTVLNNAETGVAFSQPLMAYGGLAPYAWALALGSNPLPSALQLSAEGLLSGIPAEQGSFSFTVFLQDHQGYSLERSFMLVVTPPPMSLQALGYHQSGGFLLRVGGVGGINCRIQISENFVNWTTLVSTNSASDNFDFEDNSTPHSTVRFYRLRKGG